MHIRYQQATGVDGNAQVQRQRGADAAHGCCGGLCQLRICLLAGPACAQQQSFQLISVEHQGRQQKAGPHFKTHAWIAFYRRALLAQGANITIEGTQADVQGPGQRWPGLRLACTAQQIEQSKQAGRTGHGISITRLS